MSRRVRVLSEKPKETTKFNEVRKLNTRTKRTVRSTVDPTIEQYIAMGLDALATQYSKISFDIDKKQQELELIKQAMNPVMAKEGLQEYSNRYAELKKVVPKARDKTDIDVEDLYKYLEHEDFMDCVKVKITETRKVLPGKLFDKIAKITKGPEGQPRIDIKCIAPPG